MTTIDYRDLAARWQEALALVVAGEEVVLSDGAQPRIRLVPLPAPAERVAGLHPGAMTPADDFDAPLPDDVLATTDDHLAEIERRMERAKRYPDAGMDWNEFKQWLLKTT